MSGLIDYLLDNDVLFEKDVNLSNKTWIHRGGLCKCYIQPTSGSQLESVVKYLIVNSIKFLVVGHTSNLYIHNETNVDVIVSTNRCNKYEIRENEILCEAGVGVIKLANDCVNKGIKGFEYLTGLPGTVAGALYNNSSCYQNSISELLIDLKFITDEGRTVTLYPDDLNYRFRTSYLKEKILVGTIISCRLKLSKTNSLELQRIAERNNEERKKLLEGPSRNLGCTVNRCFCNGPMPKRYRLPLKVFSKALSLLQMNSEKKKEFEKRFILFISGYISLAPYISNKQMIIFIWKDEGADKAFPKYLEFMNKIYKTDKIEIEEIING